MNPENPEVFKSDGEKKTFDYIKEKLPKEYTAYFNYRIDGQEFDFAILVPGKGVVILEVKGHYGKNIVIAENNENIRLVDGDILKSPLKQADRYRFLLIEKVKEKFEDVRVPIVSMVCYPFISFEQFKEKHLNIVSEEKETILSNDFDNIVSFVDKINYCLDRTKSRTKISNVTDISLKKVRSLFDVIDIDDKDEIELKNYYSILNIIKDSNDYKKEVEDIINLWNKGTKIILFSSSEEVLDFTRNRLKKRIGELNISTNKDFNISSTTESLYNFSLYKLPKEVSEKIKIYDGDIKDINKNRKILEYLDKETHFNLNQYEVEHALIENDIIVNAGAGTGKTYSMISRINYLIYKHKLNEKNLSDSIVLITFTNEAADNMKRRLKENLKNRYFLTKDFTIFQMIENIENMKICTIHSLTKKILKKFSVKFGLGNELKIVTGIYEMNRIIDTVTDEYFNENETIKNLNKLKQIRLYDLKKRVYMLLEKLLNKNLDIINDELDFGQLDTDNVELQAINNLIINICKESYKRIIELNNKNNTVRLSDLIVKLKLLVENSKSDLEREIYSYKYVFIDEYQDTDDVQIELIREFQKIMGFNLFVVGDIKQCIYRFRGAEDKAFELLQRISNNKFLIFSLNKNYRTDQNLLEEFHNVFKAWNDKGAKLVYNHEDKLVGINKFDKLDSKIEKIDINSDDDREKNLVEIIKYYKEKLSSKETITILVRENKQIESIKKMVNKPKYSDVYIETDIDGDLYKIRPTIDLYKLVIALENNKNPKYLYNLFTTSYIKYSMPKEEIYNNRNQRNKLVEIFNESQYIEKWSTYIERLKFEPVMKVIRDIIFDIKPWNNYAKDIVNKEENIQKRVFYKSNLNQLIEKIIKAHNNDYLTINKLSKFLEVMITTKQDADSRCKNISDYIEYRTEPRIQCMTVHKSKGLEFDVVIMPYCSSDIRDKKKRGIVDVITKNNEVGYYIYIPNIRYSKYDQEQDKNFGCMIKNNYYKAKENNEIVDREKEETRILYVAMTRSIQKFIYFNDLNSDENSSWQKLIKGE